MNKARPHKGIFIKGDEMENNVRGPTKDVVRAYYENNDVTLKELSEKFDVSYNTIKSWKNRDDKDGIPWVQPKKKKVATKDATKGTKKVAKVQNRQQAISQAKSMVIAGSTLKEASQKTSIDFATLGQKSAKEKWLESRKAYTDHLHKELISELGKQHIEDRKKAVDMSRAIANKMYKEMEQEELNLDKAKVYKEVATVVEKTIQLSSKLIGVIDLDKLEDDSQDLNIEITFEEEGQDED